MLTEGSAPGVRVTTERTSRRRAESLLRESDPAPVLDSRYADGLFVPQPVDVAEVDSF